MSKPFTVLLFLLLTYSSAHAGELPWSKLPAAKDMKPGHKTLAENAFNALSAYGACTQTLRRCLEASPIEAGTLRQADFVIRRIKAGKNLEDLQKEMKDRELSAKPPKIFSPDVSGLVASGSANAPVKVVIFADFECPSCGIASPALRKISLEHPGLLAFYFKNFPVKTHPRGIPAALALLAAERQGKFWDMHDRLFRSHDFSDDALRAIAKSAGLDVALFERDMSDPTLLDRLRREKEEGMSFGMVGTPGIFVNGKFYRGPKVQEELLDRIEEERESLAASH